MEQQSVKSERYVVSIYTHPVRFISAQTASNFQFHHESNNIINLTSINSTTRANTNTVVAQTHKKASIPTQIAPNSKKHSNICDSTPRAALYRREKKTPYEPPSATNKSHDRAISQPRPKNIVKINHFFQNITPRHNGDHNHTHDRETP